MKAHSWSFLTAATSDEAPLLVAVCSRCGLIRTSLLPNRVHERHIGLGGDCPEQPQRQEAQGGGTARTDIAK